MSTERQTASEQPAKRKPGRPTTYTEAIGRQICESIAECGSLNATLRAMKIAPGQFFRWLDAQPKLREWYARAQEIRAELLSDEIIELADTPRVGQRTKEGKDGLETWTADMVERSKLQLDARKWVASKLYPKKYGDRVGVEHSGKDGGPMRVQVEVVGDGDE